MAELDKVWVLLREREGGHPGNLGNTTVMAVYATHEALLSRIERIRKANNQYRLREHGTGRKSWTVGPESADGRGIPLGAKPVHLYAHEAAFHGAGRGNDGDRAN